VSGPAQRVNITKRTRGPNLAILADRNPGVPMDEAIMLADRGGFVIASNKRLDAALVWSSEWEGLIKGLNCWTGTMVAFKKPGEKLGKAVEYMNEKNGLRWVFPVPEGWKYVTDAILIVVHPDFCLEVDGRNRVVHAERPAILRGFPAENGRYLIESEFGITVGNMVTSCHTMERRLFRSPNDYVGLIARGFYVNLDGRGDICLGGGSETGLGVIVEARAEEKKDAAPKPEPEQAKEEEKKDRSEQKEWTISDLMTEMLRNLRNSIAGGFAYSPAGMKRNVIDMIKVMMVFSPRSDQWSDPDHTRPFIRASNMLGEFVTKELASDPRYKDIVPGLKGYFLQRLAEVKEGRK